MSREVRMVPKDWQHPVQFVKDWRNGGMKIAFKSLHDSDFSASAAEWDEEAAKWDAGLTRDYVGDGWKPKEAEHAGSYAEWAGERPDPADYMPVFAEGTATHLMMYETTSEGTPISPVFATPEELARWLTDNEASAFGGQTATYEGWLRVARGGYAPSAVVTSAGMTSGVDALL